MDKNNSSAVKQEEKLMYLSPPKDGFRPSMFITEREREVQEKGTFRALVWPAIKENPFVLLGLTMTVGALGGSMVFFMQGNRQKTQAMYQYRVIFQGLTVVALAGGYYYRDYKKRNREALKELESLKQSAE